MRPVARAEEAFGTAEEATAAIAPPDAFSGYESFRKLWLVGKDGGKRGKAPRHERRDFFVRENSSCSGDSAKVPASGSYVTKPDAACAESHSRM
ncbi:MAG: hypothetical protein L0Y50_01590 [Beijerinckiaceae bacterium]|nr:hypothetical protein [Beijerinckiaceae bacterium]